MNQTIESGKSWIGRIPPSWSLQKGKYLFVQRNEKGNIHNLELLSPTQKFGVIPQSRYEELTTSKPVKIKENTDLSSFKTIHKGDFCISLRSFQGGFEFCLYEGVVSPAYQVFYSFPHIKLHNNYYKYLFKNREFIAEMNSFTLSLRDGKNISFEDFGNTYIPVPPLPEQRRIADFLDAKCAEIDALAAGIRQEIETLEEYRKSVITEAVTKGLDKNAKMKDSGIPWIREIPEDWEVIKGKYLFVQRNEKGNSYNLQLLSPTQKFGVIPQSLYEELTTNKAVKIKEDTDISQFKTIHPGDFCISLRSFQGGFEISHHEGVVSPAYQVFYSNNTIYKEYYKHLFKERSFIAEMNSFTLSLRDGKNIAFSDFGNTYIPLPPFAEQKQIAQHLDKICTEVEAIIAAKQEQLATLDEYKKSLIYEYVTGKKEVPA